jgi:hypothetical protein
VAAKHRVRQNEGDGASQPWKQSAQPHEKHPVGRRQPRPRSLPAKHIQLMPQHGDLGGDKMFANDRSIKRDFAVKRRLFIDYQVVSENMLGAIGQLLPGDPRDFDQLRSIDEGIEKWPVIDHSQHGSNVVGFVGHAAMPGSHVAQDDGAYGDRGAYRRQLRSPFRPSPRSLQVNRRR